jgi:hypothetical protein
MVAADAGRSVVLKRNDALARRPPAIAAAPRGKADTGRCAGRANAMQPRRPLSSADRRDRVGWTLAVALVSGAPDLPVCRVGAVYYQILAPLVRRVDIWESEYLHVLEGDNPVFDWTKGTALRPYLDVLDESDRGAFLATYATRISPPTKSNRMVVPCCPSAASFSSHSCELEGSN